jgi:hypothetical protein
MLCSRCGTCIRATLLCKEGGRKEDGRKEGRQADVRVLDQRKNNKYFLISQSQANFRHNVFLNSGDPASSVLFLTWIGFQHRTTWLATKRISGGASGPQHEPLRLLPVEINCGLLTMKYRRSSLYRGRSWQGHILQICQPALPGRRSHPLAYKN